MTAWSCPTASAIPMESDSSYPFSPDHSREFLDDKPFIEPFSLIPAMGAVTEHIRFITFVLKLPIRHPLLVAKQATSVAVLTGNRLALGVGTSPWPEDYELCDVPWEGRGQRMDEALASSAACLPVVISSTTGRCTTCRSVKISPTPSVPLPILIGGHGIPALRRAARSDGWLHGGGDPADLPGLLEALRQAAGGGGHGRPPFEVHVISTEAYTVDGIRRLEDQGVTDVIVGFRWPYVTGPDTETLQAKIDNLRRFADDVIAPVRR